MTYTALDWQGPYPLATCDFAKVPAKKGVYAFTEYKTALKPNETRLFRSDPKYIFRTEGQRGTPCLLYIGKATTLSTRLRGYRFKPYLEIRRRSGPPSRHQADRHKGRALLHAAQYFADENSTDSKIENSIFLWWAETSTPETTEMALIRELHPVLNTVGIELHHSDSSAP